MLPGACDGQHACAGLSLQIARRLALPRSGLHRKRLLGDRRPGCGPSRQPPHLPRAAAREDACSASAQGQPPADAQREAPQRLQRPEPSPLVQQVNRWRSLLTLGSLIAGLTVVSLLRPPSATARAERQAEDAVASVAAGLPLQATAWHSRARPSPSADSDSRPQRLAEVAEAAVAPPDAQPAAGPVARGRQLEERGPAAAAAAGEGLERGEEAGGEGFREGWGSRAKRRLLFWKKDPYAGLPEAERGYRRRKDAYERALRRSRIDGQFVEEVMIPRRKKGKRVDTSKSWVTDPAEWDKAQEPDAVIRPATAWRNDLYKRLTYTQLHQLIQERLVEKCEWADDGLSVLATLKPGAPGGARTEKVLLPFDPSLVDHMIEHGVEITMLEENWGMKIIQILFNQLSPLLFMSALVLVSFRLTARSPLKDNLFGGADVEVFRPGQLKYTFDDVEGIDDVKEEVLKVVAFLRDPQRYIDMGIRSPAGILLVGAPGTGKTLLAKAMAGEAGVPFLTIASTDFEHMYTGVGASRVRDVFEKARQASPCILFIDEFDGVGRSRSAAGSGGEENVQTINQLLTEMDGFDDNTGVVVMAATNRPEVLDEAIKRPGRFDRMITLPLPNLQGRVAIMKVHARRKKLDSAFDWERVARATAGATGADLMNLMNESASVAARRGARALSTEDTFQALEDIQRQGQTRGLKQALDSEAVPPAIRKANAVYMAGRALLGFLTPQYDELAKVVVNPGGTPAAYVYFLPSEDFLESGYVTRGYLEGKLVVDVAGRVAERLVLGDNAISLAGQADVEHANGVAREMVLRYGFNARLGPVQLLRESVDYLNPQVEYNEAALTPEVQALANCDIRELLHAAEAKATYAMVKHWDLLKALVGKLIAEETVTGAQMEELAAAHGAKRFPTPFIGNYTFEQAAAVSGPGTPTEEEMAELREGELFTPLYYVPEANRLLYEQWADTNPYRLNVAAPYVLSRDARDLSGAAVEAAPAQ